MIMPGKRDRKKTIFSCQDSCSFYSQGIAEVRTGARLSILAIKNVSPLYSKA